MINLMYLVLTAMLALNVSSEILHAFKIINNSIGKSNQSIEGKNNELMMSLQGNEDMPGHKERVKPYNDAAKEVHAKANEVYAYMEAWKAKVIEKSGGYIDGKPGEIKAEDNIDASTSLLVEKNGGDEIKAKLLELRKFMLAAVRDEKVKAQYEKDFPLQVVEPPKSEDNPSGDWAFGTFHNVPTLAAVTLFAKMQNDIRNSESLVISELSREADAKPIKFDAIAAIAVPKTTYVMTGAPVEAQIMFAAYNTSAMPTISTSAGTVKVENGVGTWKGTANGVGMQTVKGSLSVNLGDRVETQPWSFQYMVGSAGASMQLDKMNVFYIGVENPITVTAAGYSLEDVSVSIPGASVNGTEKGKYAVSVTKEMMPEVTAVINAKTATGIKQVGASKIRIKRIPDPIAILGGKRGGVIAANAFRAQMGPVALLENFDFQARYEIVSFDFSYQPKRKDYVGPLPVTGTLFSGNPTVSTYVKTLAAIGDRVYIDNIKARGPDGSIRAIGTISFVLN